MQPLTLRIVIIYNPDTLSRASLNMRTGSPRGRGTMVRNAKLPWVNLESKQKECRLAKRSGIDRLRVREPRVGGEESFWLGDLQVPLLSSPVDGNSSSLTMNLY